MAGILFHMLSIMSQKVEPVIQKIPLTFTAEEDNSSILLTINEFEEGEHEDEPNPVTNGLQYRLGTSGEWLNYNIDKNITLTNIGDIVQFQNTNNQLTRSIYKCVNFRIFGRISASGNIQSMLNYSNSCAENCYCGMFENCASLTTAPELPATTLANGCYSYMFWYCTSLTKAPKILPATNLVETCYHSMFSYCTSLTKAPELPATTLAKGCYIYMFNNCENLNYIKVGFTNWDDDLIATQGWLDSVSPTGTFECQSELDTTKRGYDYIPENWSISSEITSDLVELGILPKPISEFTNDDIGTTIISIPYNDASGNITGPIEFEVVGVNHHKDINDESKPTITLMTTKNIIREAAFDAKESTNPDSVRANYGNNRWSVSNIRQWLNSEGVANEWFTPQHEYDTTPDTSNIDLNNSGAYADDPGFLAGFSDEIKQHFAIVRNKTILCDYDKELLSKDFEETEDKVFLPSYTEMGFGNLDENNHEGSHLSQKFIDDMSRSIGPTYSEYREYWMRSPTLYGNNKVYYVNIAGKKINDFASIGDRRHRSAYSSLLSR